jgi:VWFA-related protein
MKRLLTPLLIIVTLSLLMARYQWFDLFHIVVILAAVAIAIGAWHWLAGRRREDDAIADESAPLLMRVLTSVAKTAALAIVAGVAVWGMEHTQLYPWYTDRDLKEVQATARTLEDAGNAGRAADQLRQRLRKPISAKGRTQLTQRLCDDLVKASRQSTDTAAATACLQEAKRLAAEMGFASDLADEYLARLREQDGSAAQLEIWKRQGQWAEAAASLRERLRQTEDRAKAKALTADLVAVLAENGPSLEARADAQREALALAAKHGLDERPIRKQLAELDGELQRRAAFDRKLDAMIDQKLFAAANAALREELVRGEQDAPRGQAIAKRLYDVQVAWAHTLSDAERDARLQHAIEDARKNGIDDGVAQAMLREGQLSARSQRADKAHAVELTKLKQERDQAMGEAKSAQDRCRQLTGEAAECRSKAEASRIALANRVAATQPRAFGPGVDTALNGLSIDHWPLVLAQVVVRQRGRHVPGLEARDFVVLAGDQQTPCVAAALDGAVHRRPVRVTVVIDVSGSMMGARLQAAREAARKFLGALPPEVPVQLIAFSSDVHEKTPFTTDRATLIQAIDQLNAGGETALFRAISVAAEKGSAARAGRDEVSVIVVLTDGENTVAGIGQNEAVAVCRQHAIRVHTIGLNIDGIYTDPLKQIAEQTGGKFIEATRPEQLVEAFQNAAQHIIEPYYLLAFTVPTAASPATVRITVGSGPNAATLLVPLPSTPRNPTVVARP